VTGLNKDEDLTVGFINDRPTRMKPRNCDRDFLTPALPAILTPAATNRLTSPHTEDRTTSGDDHVGKSLIIKKAAFLKLWLSQKNIENTVRMLTLITRLLARLISKKPQGSVKKEDTTADRTSNDRNQEASHMMVPLLSSQFMFTRPPVQC